MRHRQKIEKGMVQIQVDCPRWIQKRMRANLTVAAKMKVNQERAEIANTILKTTKAKPPTQSPAAVIKTSSSRPSVEIIRPVQTPVRTARLGIWQSTKASFCKLVKHISSSLQGRRVFRPAHQRV